MTRLPPPPPEPPPITTAVNLAPAFRRKLANVMLSLANLGWRPYLVETLRTTERAAWLYGMGRTWDDGRGIVTNAPNALKTWHHFALAADISERSHSPEHVPQAFHVDLGRIARGEGLTWGGDWSTRDYPHVQFHRDGMHVSPSDHAAALLARGGVEAVWAELHATP